MSGDGLRPPLNAPPAADLGYGVTPGAQTPIVRANLVIISGPTGSVIGLFIYTPGTTPALGNPPIAWSSSSTVDPFGNPLPSTTGIAGTGTFKAGNTVTTPQGTVGYTTSSPAANTMLYSDAPAAFTDSAGNAVLAGVTVYGRSGLTYYAQNVSTGNTLGTVFGGTTTIYTGTDMTAWTAQTELDMSAAIWQLSSTGLWLRPTSGTNAQIVVSNPASLGVQEGWHNMTLLNGWTLGGSGYAQYKLEPNNRVSVRGANVTPGTVTGGTSIWTPPAAYAPVTTQRIVLVVEVSTGAAGVETPRLDVVAGGLEVFNIPGSTTLVGWNSSYATD